MTNVAVLGLLAAGAYYLLNGTVANQGKPVFYNMSKQVITSIQCGNSVIFDCPGYSTIWLVRTKNGVQDFSGLYTVPAPPYIMNCSTDPGTYTLTAYAVAANGLQGALLGSTTFTVTPSS